MKTAISIPDGLYAEAELLAKALGISRSELYQKAVDEFLRNNRSTGVTDRLNSVYGTGKSTIDSQLFEMQTQSLDSEDWE